MGSMMSYILDGTTTLLCTMLLFFSVPRTQTWRQTGMQLHGKAGQAVYLLVQQMQIQLL